VDEAFWQAKIWGLLENINLGALENYIEPEAQPYLSALLSSPASTDISQIADLITDASDRAVLNIAHRQFYGESPTIFGETNTQELTVAHLLSGKKLTIPAQSLPNSKHQESATSRTSDNLNNIDNRQLFWWLWRCFPQLVCQHHQSLMLAPAATSLPDASVWSHSSLRAAMAGTLATYGRIPQQSSSQELTPRPYLAIFSFTPVQEIVKSSRKMRDFWAGSWVLHYLSAKVCWELAQHYGPDSLIYPSLFQQPLIDHWLTEKYQGFTPWIEEPSPRDLLTAGFPNVIVALLPQGEVKAAMQTAKQTLYREWLNLGNLVFAELQQRHWTRQLRQESRTWNGWLKSQWQPYWTALPLGANGEDLTNQVVLDAQDWRKNPWLQAQNDACNLGEDTQLFKDLEFDFLQAVKQNFTDTPVGVNVGSWWPYIFDQLRFGLSAVKNARTWDIPTAFSPRSTISGIGPVVYPDSNEHQPREKNQHDPITEAQTKEFWQKHAGLFDGIEQLNATETLKRGIHHVLPNPTVLGLVEGSLNAAYPDLTAGVAGYLRVNYPKNDPRRLEHFRHTCESVRNYINQSQETKENILEEMREDMKWGIPWLESQHPNLMNYPPRFLNAGWLVADLEISEQKKPNYRTELQQHIAQFYPNNNPADWYVLAAGDGDGMSRWLKGLPLKNYQDYMSSTSPFPDTANPQIGEAFNQLKQLKKRMGPSTHNALSRALLDFSNKLLPYLTEQRYTGRLIYGGGDDVLAYTNLWEWDKWLWDVRQCFRGAEDQEYQEFNNEGDYWRWQGSEPPAGIPQRPLFTMGSEATISFGIVIAHHSVPLAIALENLWEAEEKAKDHSSPSLKPPQEQESHWPVIKKLNKNAVQVRVLYGSGNSLKATSKFAVFRRWRSLLNLAIEPALFEQAAQIWSQHPAPNINAIAPWTQAFVNRRELFQGQEQKKQDFQWRLAQFIRAIIWTTQQDGTNTKERDTEIQNWLKLAAFVLRKRHIEIRY